jgi:hypothetical protein
MIGPVGGPISKPRPYIALAGARSCKMKRSAITAPAIDIGVDAPIPAKNRKAISSPVDVAKIHAILKAVNMTLEMFITHRRPYISDNGAKTRGPSAQARRYMVRVRAKTVSDLMLYFFAISGKPGAMIELARGLGE